MSRDEAIAVIADLGEASRAALRLGISAEEAAERILDSIPDWNTDDPYKILALVRDAARALR